MQTMYLQVKKQMETWWRVSPRVVVKDRWQGRSAMASFQFLFLVGGDLHKQQKCNNQLILVCLSLFRFVLGLFSSSRFAVRGSCCVGRRRTDLGLYAPLCSV